MAPIEKLECLQPMFMQWQFYVKKKNHHKMQQ